MNSAIISWMPAIVAVIAFGGTLVARFLPDRSKREPSWVELSNENRSLRSDLTELQKRFNNFESRVDLRDAAFAVIFQEASSQWPADHEGPYFSPEPLAVIADTLPPVWRNRVRNVA